MAPLPPNSTGTLFVHYRANGHDHTFQVRYPGEGAPASDFISALDDFCNAMAVFMPNDTANLGLEYREAGSHVALPISPGLSTWAGSNGPLPAVAPAYFNFIGRSSLGRRVRLMVLGVSINPVGTAADSADYRYAASEHSGVAAAIAALQDVNAIAIDGGTITWKAYVNLGYNAHWQRAVRN